MGRPVILVDHVKVLDEIQPMYAQVKRAAFEAFYPLQEVQVVPPHEIKAFVEKNIAPIKQVQKNDVYLVKAKKLLQEGVQAYQQLEFDRAEKLLSESRDQWILNLSHLRSNRDLLKAHLYLAMTLLALQKENAGLATYKERAEKELDKAVHLDTELSLSPRTYSPEVIETFEKIKQKVLQKSRVTLRINSNIKNANIYLNGKRTGQAPLTKRLVPGTYYVLAETADGKSTPWTKLVTLKATVETLQAQIKPLINVAKEQNLFRIREGIDQRSDDVSFVQNRARALGADMVFLSNIEQVEGYRILGQLFDVRTGEFSQVAFVHLGKQLNELRGASMDLAQAMVTQIREDGYLVSSNKPNVLDQGQDFTALGQAKKKNKRIQQADKPKTQLYKKWWFWLGLAAIGGGGYYWVNNMQGGSGDIKINNAGNF